MNDINILIQNNEIFSLNHIYKLSQDIKSSKSINQKKYLEKLKENIQSLSEANTLLREAMDVIHAKQTEIEYLKKQIKKQEEKKQEYNYKESFSKKYFSKNKEEMRYDSIDKSMVLDKW